MKIPHRIGYDLLDDNLKTLLNAGMKIFPISQNEINNNLNPNNYEFVKLQADNIVYIYTWNSTVWGLIGAEDNSVDWNNDVKNKPLTFPNSLEHSHDNMSLLNTVTQSLFNTWNSAVTHISDLIKHITSAERTLWNSKANGTHTHVKTNITDFPTIPTDTSQLTKTDVYTKTQIDASLTLKSDATHNHDGRYSTPAQVALKSDLTHNHDTTYQSIGSYALSTHNHDATYAVKSIETTVAQNTTDINAMETNMANGDMHSNISVLNQLTQGVLDLWNSAVTHISDGVKHITSAERTAWNAKQNALGFTAVPTTRTINSKALSANVTLAKADIGLTNVDNTTDANKPVSTATSTALSGKADKSYVDTQDALKVDSTTFNGHTGNSTIHVTQTDKDNLALKSQIYQGIVEPVSTAYWFKEV